VNYTRAIWTQYEGVLLGTVSAITQDGPGYLWIGTPAGLFRFDGVRFVRWEALGPPLPDSNVSVLATARDGGIWVGFRAGGVSHVVSGSVHSYTWMDGMLPGPVFSVLEDHSGTVWVGGTFGLARRQRERWNQVGVPQGIGEGLRVLTIAEDRAGTLWLGTDRGLLRYRLGSDSFERWDTVEGRANAIVQDRSGAVWVANPTPPQISIKAGNPVSVAIESLAASLLFRDRRGYLWFTTDRGLFCIEHEQWREQAVLVLPRDPSSSGADEVRALFEDREGNIWAGTNTSLSRITPVNTFRLSTEPGFAPDEALVVVADLHNGVWVGTANGVVHLTDGSTVRYSSRDGLPGKRITSLHIDHDGVLWAATTGGIARFAGNRFIPLRETKGLSRIVAMTSNDEGLWMCDFTGLYLWNRRALKSISGPDQRPGAATAYVDTNGRLWVGFVTGGAWVYDKGSVRAYTPDDGLPDAIVSAFHEDREGAMWVATTKGLARFKDGRFAIIGHGLPGGAIYSLVDDGDGNVWLCMQAGLVRVSQRDLARAVTDPAAAVPFRFLDAQDGFNLAAWVGAPLAARATDGSLWFVTRTGPTVVHPSEVRELPTPPPVQIETVWIDEHPSAPVPHLGLSPSTIHLEVDYTSLTFSASSKVRFRYRLEGLDRDWVEADTQRRLFYTNLAPGDYRLRIAARSLGGAWTESTDWDFTVRAPFYRTKSFTMAAALLIGVALWLVWRQRVLTLQRRYSAVLAERARVGREIHDTLLQGMVGVALQLAAVAERLEPSSTSVKASIERARDNLERYISETRDSIWELRSPLLDRGLASALREFGDSLVTGTSIRLDVRESGAPAPIPGEIQQQLLRIAKEAIANAVRHSKATNIRVDLRYAGGHVVELSIGDDGRGFSCDESHESNQWGLRIMRERAAQIGARLRVSSGQTGTTVALTLGSRPLHG
jgi:signal transduction histidine kinase/ligand-binding sensor domain-containing protein